MLVYAAIIYSADNTTPGHGRSLQLEVEEAAGPEPEVDARFLAKAGADPPAIDAIPNQYIVKPWVGNAAEDVYEDLDGTAIILSSFVRAGLLGHDPRLYPPPRP